MLAILVASLATGAQADDFYLLSGDQSAYDAHIELIDLAQDEISIAYYAIDSGDVALTLISRLRQAARRGVKVNILLDGLKSRLPSDFEDLLIRDGIELRVYHPPKLGHPLWLNRRLHYKLFVVDRKAMIIGSRNLEDSHFGLDQQNFADMDALFTGDVCCQAADHFFTLWNSDEVFPVAHSHSFGLNLRNNIEMKARGAVALSVLQTALPGRRGSFQPPNSNAIPSCDSMPVTRRPLVQKRFEMYERRMTEATQRIQGSQALTDRPSGSCMDPWVENIGCSVLIHDRGTDKSARHFQSQVIAILDTAQHCLWIESPYPVLERPVKDAIERAIQRGVNVTLFTNSLGSTDRTAPYAAYQNDKLEYDRMGVQLVEYTGVDTLHSKSILVDDESVLISSYNMDARADRLNLEFGVWVRDARVCKVVKHEVSQRMQQGEVVQQNALRLPKVIRGNASLFKQSRMRIRQLLVPLIRTSL
jgi:phosphatidylserine/phosphatidylglycerophosphate/cardiolipin synthase-like enzyme